MRRKNREIKGEKMGRETEAENKRETETEVERERERGRYTESERKIYRERR